MRKFHKKAQVNILDLIIALSIALILIVAIMISWDRFAIKLGKKTLQNDLQVIAFQLSDQLLSNTGTPVNWETNTSNISSLGLAIEDRILSRNKVLNFTMINYDTIKSLLNIENYWFNFNLSYLDENQVVFVGTPANGSYVVNIRRLVRYDNRTAQVKISIWK